MGEAEEDSELSVRTVDMARKNVIVPLQSVQVKKSQLCPPVAVQVLISF